MLGIGTRKTSPVLPKGGKEGQVLKRANDGHEQIRRGQVPPDVSTLSGFLQHAQQEFPRSTDQTPNAGGSLFGEGLGELV